MREIKVIVIAPFSYIIGEVTKECEEFIEFSKPILMTPVMTQGGNFQLAPTPIMTPKDDIIKINKNKILIFPFIPPDDLYKEYVKITSSIQLV